MSKTRIIIADDHPVFLAGLRAVVESEPDIEIVGEASDGDRALTMVKELRPDVAAASAIGPFRAVGRRPVRFAPSVS